MQQYATSLYNSFIYYSLKQISKAYLLITDYSLITLVPSFFRVVTIVIISTHVDLNIFLDDMEHNQYEKNAINSQGPRLLLNAHTKCTDMQNYRNIFRSFMVNLDNKRRCCLFSGDAACFQHGVPILLSIITFHHLTSD